MNPRLTNLALLTLLALLLFAVYSLALATPAPAVPGGEPLQVTLEPTIIDPQTWPAFFVSTGSLAGLVAIVVAFLREHTRARYLEGKSVILLSLAVGVALNAAGAGMGFYSGDLPGMIGFGATAGAIASGAYDLLRAT